MKRVVIITVLALLASLVAWVPAQARTCPSASIGGPAVATVTVRGKAVPVKRVTYRNGGVLLPPATNLAAGISTRNASLGAKKGSTIITWHVRYGPGCDGSLNDLITMPIGSTFSAGVKGKPAQTYQISSRTTVPQGKLKRSWFTSSGPHRLVLITCADLRGGHFRKTMAIIATPVPAAAPAAQPTPSVAIAESTSGTRS
jgi:hypothetical protein